MALDEASVQHIVDSLARRHFVMEKSGFGSRVPKFQHRFCNSEYGPLKFSAQELAILCELLLRGPQTPGELRTRASRMAEFAATGAVEAALASLAERADGPFVTRLPRETGRRDARYAHLFSGEVPTVSAAPSAEPAAAPSRLDRLEEELRQVRAELDELKTRVAR
jgi:hypothetical protein